MARTLSIDAHVATRPVVSHAPHTTVLIVENMTCGGCMRAVEAALLAVPGVTGARANLSTRRVVVSTPERPAVEKLIEGLAKAGYSALPLADNPASTPTSSDDGLIRSLAVAGFGAMNIMLLSVSVWSGRSGEMDPSLQSLMHWLSAAIALPTVACAGRPFFWSAVSSLRARRINMDVPISLGVVLATAMSLYQTVRHSDQVYFDAAVSLLFFLLIGRVLDLRVRRQAQSAAENLLALRSPTATRLNVDGTSERVATSTIMAGERILIAAGERIPVDARVSRGRADIDEQLITGESRPRTVHVGEQLYSGTINLSGPIEAVATAGEANTLLTEIAGLMQTAEQARGRYVRLADRAARLYAPAVHVLGIATFAGWMIAGRGWEAALTAAISVLIITCPCALALAVPAVQVAAIGRLFEHGIIVKAPDGLERLAEVDTIVLDKTGTLTLGEPRLVEGAAVADADLRSAATLAAASRHPYSRAIMRALHDRGLAVEPAAAVEELPGEGLCAMVSGVDVRLGSARFCSILDQDAERPTVWLRRGTADPVAFTFEDALRADAKTIVRQLQRAGFQIELLSGDRAPIVATVAQAAGIPVWRAEQRPDQKVAVLRDLASRGRRVLMVGDGLNDAPALVAGHASLSPSTAADVSQTAADVVFQGARLAPLAEVLAVARAAHRCALQNFVIAIGYNLVFVPLAMLGLVTPLVAAIAMSVSSVTVTANALWLRTRQIGFLS